jgi:hypothetical protein
VDELVYLLRCEETIQEDIYILALLVLVTKTQDRLRQFNILIIINASGHQVILPNFMQKPIRSIMASTPRYLVSFVEVVLSLVTILISSSIGVFALNEAHLISTIPPLL